MKIGDLVFDKVKSKISERDLGIITETGAEIFEDDRIVYVLFQKSHSAVPRLSSSLLRANT